MADLILVPTAREMRVLRPLLCESIGSDNRSFQLCGFGLVAAAARTGALVARYKPQRVMLIGIAGSYDTRRLPIATAHRFDTTSCDGVGVGTGSEYRSAGEIGWHHFDGGDAAPTIGEQIALDSSYIEGVPAAGLLLSCCSASASSDDAKRRRARFPTAMAEDMEGFAVALACSLARVPLQIVRGISNRVGERDMSQWQVDKALRAAAGLATKLMPREWMPNQT